MSVTRGGGIASPVSKPLDECLAAMAVVRAREVQMDRPKIVGSETQYIGRNQLLRGSLVRVESVIPRLGA